MKLSLCMIVKDEEKLLAGCLEAIAAHVDEMVVVDTGSADSTAEIAKAHGAKVHTYEWSGDFAAARNFSLAQAQNDWVLVLDADEYLVGWDNAGIADLMQSDGNVGRIQLVNDYSEDGVKAPYYISRIFNRLTHSYNGRVHEQIQHIDGGQSKLVPLDGVRFLHYGYNPDIMAEKSKLERNAALLEQELESNPNDPYLLYQMGKAWYYRKTDLEKAVHYFGLAAKNVEDYRLEFAADLFTCYGYALINTGRLEQALALEELSKHYSANAKFMFMMGHAYMNNARFNEAVAAYKQCIAVRNVDAGLAQLANYNIGVIYDCTNNAKNAIKFYSRAAEYPPAQKRLHELRGTAAK